MPVLPADGGRRSGAAHASSRPSLLRGSGQLYFGIKLLAGKIFSTCSVNNKEREERDTLQAAVVPALSPLRKLFSGQLHVLNI